MKVFFRRVLIPTMVMLALFLMYQITPVDSVVISKKTSPVAQRQLMDKKGAQQVLVKRVVDGDTIELETGEKVRYIGVDTPETVSPKKKVQCFGKEASAYNKQLVAGQRVRLEKDISETDRYGRLLRYVYLSDGTFVNLKLVQDGYANVSTFPPDVKFSQGFVAAAREAREKKVGLWEKCKRY